MDLQTLLTLGERIELRIDRQSYRSVVQDVPGPADLLALHPLDKRNLPVHLDYDVDIDVIFFRANGQFTFKSRLESRARVGNVAVVRLTVPEGEEPAKMQRRNGYRLPYVMTVTIRPINPAVPMEDEYKVVTVDLSEGGVQIEFPRMIGLGTMFNVEFPLFIDGMVEDFSLRAAISRMLPPEEIGGPWRLGLRFTDCPEDVRRRLARFILLEQVNRRME